MCTERQVDRETGRQRNNDNEEGGGRTDIYTDKDGEPKYRAMKKGRQTE